MPVRIWRLIKARYASAPLSGEGARLYGGRWNERGTAVVYAASTLALAELEMLVHVERADAPADLVAIELEIPDDVDVEDLGVSSLPADWRSYPPRDALARIGTDWARSLRTAVLRVPSAVVPQEHNYLVNPAHGDAVRIEVIGSAPVVFDARLFATTRPKLKAKKKGTKKKRAGKKKAGKKKRGPPNRSR